MLMKRFYAKPEGWVKQVNTRNADGRLVDPSKPEGDCLNPPPLDFVSLGHTGIKREQNFSVGLVLGALKEGWLTIAGDKLTLKVEPEPLVYTIVRAPGHYCCHCKQKLDSDDKGELAQLHVQLNHAGVASPDPKNWPAGYLRTGAYECVLDAGQHEKFRVKRAGRPPVFPKRHAEVSHG